ncbi:McrC family protein [Fulvivirga maritima]|uniref:McrC family protein n=1 Tax=Fulvivirga maritima TaxID=2904247 RepID=UPI002106DBEF|nr:McrC family protein [Fulvivirga maritima]
MIKKVVIDTKWKFQSKVSLEDLRQVYAYLHYFESNEGYLLYPDQVKDAVRKEDGDFQNISKDKLSDLSCGLMFADLIIVQENKKVLNREIGEAILKAIQLDSAEKSSRKS